MQGKLGPISDEAARAIRVLVVDDHPVMRAGLGRLINAQPGFNVVGDATDGRVAFQLLERLQPDIAIIDIELGAEAGDHASGDAFVRRVVSAMTNTRVVVYTANDGANRVVDSIRNGARGYVIKSHRPERMYEAMRVVAGGGFYLDPAIASLVMARIGRVKDSGGEFDQALSEREQAVLDRLVEGKRNSQIAIELFISERTVKFHVSSLFRKLRAKSRTDVVRIALQHGLV